ncbi:hypothetical protein [Streptomyces sp. NPDC001415]
MAWDGTGLQVPDSTLNFAFCGRAAGKFGLGGFPLMRLTALVEGGTRTLLDVTVGSWKQSEKDQALLCRALRPGMLLLADRGSNGVPLACAAAATGAHLSWRTSTDRLPPVLHLLPDGTYLSMATGQNERARLARWPRHRRGIPPQAQGPGIAGDRSHRHRPHRRPAQPHHPAPADHHTARPRAMPRPIGGL